MKNFLITILFLLYMFDVAISQENATIIDHSCTQVNQIPESWILKAKSEFRIAYGHTSHGSQIVSGMDLLSSVSNSIFKYNNGDGSLYLNDASLLEGDLGNPDRETWASRTRYMLMNNSQNINMIMWSWCGQVDGSASDIELYLSLMNQLEQDFPNIKFVYMTGHLNGTGVDGNVNQRNEQIRKFCRENDKILYDFADIESYDPDGNYFLDKYADDGCNYNGGNWADEWCEANPGECSECDCAHSKCINCQQKGKAFWWMLARIAGWDEITSVNDYSNDKLFLSPNPASEYIEFDKEACLLATEIQIYNTFGECVMSTSVNFVDTSASGGQKRIDISQLSVGIYFLQIGNYSEKFMVVR